MSERVATASCTTAVAFAAVILTAGTVTALAASSPPVTDVTKNAMNGVNRATGAKGDTGSQGPQGVPGQTVLGDGVPGPQGDPGPQGAAAPTLDYGVANVLVSRGGATATIWAQYATPLGSPVGNNTASGVFRFTCSPGNAPCAVSVSAAVLGSADHTIYPRLLIYKEGDGNGGGDPQVVTCEYADGSTGAVPMTIAHQASSSTPAYTAIPTNIGGSADCGNVPAGPAGNVATIIVPNGYYDVHSTFTFS
jgi:hypothetical protein